MSAEPAQSAALAGRLPVLPEERVFVTSGSFARTCVTFGSAIWIFLVGSALPAFGSTRLAIVGYAAGLIIGYVPVALTSGIPSFRYGVDTVDAAKSVFGVRGTFVPLIGILGTSIIWITVIMALVAQWLNTHLIARAGAGDPRIATLIALGVLAIVWYVVRAGPVLIQRMNDFVGPMILAVATISLVLLLHRFGWQRLWFTNLPPKESITSDGLKAVAYAVEYGVATSLAWWPFLGGLFRLVKFRRQVVGPSMIGLTIVGGAYVAAVAALAAASFATSDPLNWIVRLAGPVAGTALVILILIGNVPTMGMLLYFAAVSVQQIRALARIPWSALLALMLVLPAFGAFYIDRVLGHVLTVAAYVGFQFIAVTAVGCVDYYLLRRQQVEVEQLFNPASDGTYWFWGGVNWAAVLIVALGSSAYLMLYNPVSLDARYVFRYFGASLPVMAGCGILYYCVMRLLGRRGVGGYRPGDASADSPRRIEVGL